MNEIDKLLNLLNDAPNQLNNQLSETEKMVLEKALNLAKQLEINASGKIKPSVVNLKKLNQIKGQLRKTLLAKEYLKAVESYLSEVRTIVQIQNKLYGTNPAKYDLFASTTIKNTLETLTGKGYTDVVVQGLHKIIQTSIVSGGSYTDLTNQLNKLLVSGGKQSIIKKQVQTPVVDALNVFSAQNMKLITDDLGLAWFMYVGSNKVTTREFCEHLTKKRYVHRSEIEVIVTGLIDEHQCKLGANELPLGMYDDTNADNFQVQRGGYNCGHQLIPVSSSVVPIHIRMKYETQLSNDAYMQEYQRLKDDTNYYDVEYNNRKGVKATHNEHTFHPTKGHYETEARDILFEEGNIITLESEKGTSGTKFADGYLNGLKADIKAIEGIGKNNIKRKFQEAESQGAESIILYYPNKDLFSTQRLEKGIAMFKGQSQYSFKEIIYIVDGKVHRR